MHPYVSWGLSDSVMFQSNSRKAEFIMQLSRKLSLHVVSHLANK